MPIWTLIQILLVLIIPCARTGLANKRLLPNAIPQFKWCGTKSTVLLCAKNVFRRLFKPYIRLQLSEVRQIKWFPPQVTGFLYGTRRYWALSGRQGENCLVVHLAGISRKQLFVLKKETCWHNQRVKLTLKLVVYQKGKLLQLDCWFQGIRICQKVI